MKEKKQKSLEDEEQESVEQLAKMVTTYPSGNILSYSEMSEKTRKKVDVLRKEIEHKRKKGEISAEGWYPVQKVSYFLF